MSVAEIHEVTQIDPWFLQRVADIVALENKVRRFGLPADAENLRLLKAAGFSDARLAALAGIAESDVAKARGALGVAPVFKRIDTCAAEFASPTAYMYSTYETPVRRRAQLRGAPERARQDRHSRRRAEPHRAGDRIRLLLLPRRVRAARRGLRDDHDQLQSGDRVDRLRHLGSPLFRAADRGGRARHPRRRSARRGR